MSIDDAGIMRAIDKAKEQYPDYWIGLLLQKQGEIVVLRDPDMNDICGLAIGELIVGMIGLRSDGPKESRIVKLHHLVAAESISSAYVI